MDHVTQHQPISEVLKVLLKLKPVFSNSSWCIWSFWRVMHISIIAVERSCGLKVFHLWLLSYLVQFFFMIPDIFFIFWYWSLHMQIVSWSTQDFTPRNHFATATWSTTEKRIKRLNFPANFYLFCKQNNAFPLLILNAIFSFVSWENLEFLFKFSRAFVDLNQLSINTLSSFFF